MPRKKTEIENPPNTKGRNPRVSKGAKETAPVSKIEEQPKCYIHEEFGDWVVDEFRENVCVKDEPLTEFEGNYYCLFHLPTKKKDIAKFEQIFQARLKAVEDKIAEIEKLPENEQAEAKREVCYDFRYVWFPSEVNLSNYKFSARAFFRFAIFSAVAKFSLVTFSDIADFLSTTFSAEVSFDWTTFSVAAYFNWVNFSADAYFNGAKFLETSQVFFQQTRFCKTVDFKETVFAGYVAFEGKRGENVFLDKKAVLEVKKELNEKFGKLQKELARRGSNFQIPDNFVENQETVLELQNARLEKPERISFHRVRLCPSWFVNIDSREMVFTDVSWDNLDRQFRNPNINAEIESLEKRKVSEPRRLLEIACRQLGVNAEENNRYEEASKFRYMAMETKRLEYLWEGRLWTLSWWYRLSSGYGENWSQAFVVLLGILFLCGIFYNSPFAYFEMPEKKKETENVIVINDLAKPKLPEYYKMNNFEGFIHSLYVAAIQRPEPKPAADSNLTKAFVILETIFAPLQAALLALAIRRKFMR